MYSKELRIGFQSATFAVLKHPQHTTGEKTRKPGSSAVKQNIFTNKSVTLITSAERSSSVESFETDITFIEDDLWKVKTETLF